MHIIRFTVILAAAPAAAQRPPRRPVDRLDPVRVARIINDCEKNIPRTRTEINRAIAVALDINTTMNNRRMGPECEREWDVVRAELNRLAGEFNLRRIPVR